eukprot:scaffold27530_cov45-Phaeocystis_antarctica.AAC.3
MAACAPRLSFKDSHSYLRARYHVSTYYERSRYASTYYSCLRAQALVLDAQPRCMCRVPHPVLRIVALGQQL